MRDVNAHRIREYMTGAANFVKQKVSPKGVEYLLGIAPPLSFAHTYIARELGVNRLIAVSTATLIIATGNNIEFRGDMSTRAILCSMDAKVERPEARRYDVDLRVEVPRRQGELVAAALTILRAFVVAGRPGARDLEPFGRFEEWSDLVRGALVWAGEADPCDSRAKVAGGDIIASFHLRIELARQVWQVSYPPKIGQ